MTADTISLIQSYDIGPHRARQNAQSELARFGIEDIHRILNCLTPLEKTAGSRDICGPPFNRHEKLSLTLKATLWTALTCGTALLLPFQGSAAVLLLFRGQWRAIWKELPRPTFDLINWCWDMISFIKAPIHLIKESISTEKALCVNRKGRFMLKDKDYAVMSHVWGETMGWQTPEAWGPVDLSLRKMGISRSHFLRFFDHCEAEWLWVDVIAMPEALEDMDDAQKTEMEELRIGIINCLHSICTKAEEVVVIDTLLLRLSTRSPIDVAATLCLSFWATRLWTFVEARLAKKVILKTRDWSFDLDTILEFITKTAFNDAHRYYGILLRLVHIREESVHGYPPCSLLESAYWSSLYRHTEVDADPIRILYPLLNLKWQSGWTLQQGANGILQAYPEETEWLQKWCHYRDIDVHIESNASEILISL